MTAIHPSVRRLYDWLTSFAAPPSGSEDYLKVIRWAEELAFQALDAGADYHALEPIREFCSRVYSTVTLDPRSVLADPRLIQEVESSPLIPLLPDGYFRDYYLYARGCLAPVEYAVLLSFAVLGAWMGRRAWHDRAGRFTVYPPCSALLLSTQAGVGKGTAMTAARKLLEATGYQHLADDRISGSAFLSDLAERSAAAQEGSSPNGPTESLIFAAELSGFYGMEDKTSSYLIVTIADLLDMPHGAYKVRTQARGREIFYDPTVTHVGGSNLAWLAENMPRNTFTGGWFARQMISVQTPEDIPRIGLDLEAPRGSLQQVLADLSACRQVSGNLPMTPEALRRLAAFQEESLTRIHGTGDERLAAYLKRLPVQALRLGMLTSMSLGRGVIEAPELDRAWEICRYLERSHGHLYARVGGTAYGSARQVVYDLIRRRTEAHGGVTKVALKAEVSHLGIRFRDHTEILADLLDSDLIQQISIPESEKGELPGIGYRVAPKARGKEIAFDPLKPLLEGDSLQAEGTVPPILAPEEIH